VHSAKVGALQDDQIARSSKIINGDGRRWLRSRNHPYRGDLQINGRKGLRRVPTRMTVDQVMLHAENGKCYLESGGRAGADEDPIYVADVKRRSTLFDLPY
jgi:hypothetical protein